MTIALLTELERALESASARSSPPATSSSSLKERFGKETIPADGGAPVRGAVRRRAAEGRSVPRAAGGPLRSPEGTIGLKLALTEAPTAAGRRRRRSSFPRDGGPKAADATFLVHRTPSSARSTSTRGASVGARAPARSASRCGPSGTTAASSRSSTGTSRRSTRRPARSSGASARSQMRVLAMHAAHGKAYLMLRPALAASSVTVRAFDIVTGEKLRDAELAARLRAANSRRSASSPLWLLCRLDAAVGSTAVLDGITGELVYSRRRPDITPLPRC